MSEIMRDTKRMPMNDLRKTAEYLRLTPKQKLWVSTYVESGIASGEYDAKKATRYAYDCKDEESARCMSYTLLHNLSVVEALNRHFNTDPTQEFLKMLNRAIRNKNLTRAQVTAMKLKWDILGLGRKSKEWDNLEEEVEKAETEKAKKPAKAATVVPWNPTGK